MGTNYYWIKDPCPTCGHGERLHIGKSSAGWPFLFRAHDGIAECVDDWRRILKGERIVDEYERDVTSENLWALVESKQKLVHEPHVQDCLREHGDRWAIIIGGHPFSDYEFS